ncbi:MAG: cobaltochelatase subunit CobN, partial [Cyanobacteria bacterium]|nr:cobaltochelatase subunit CobN [Cyanobacteriota bacterium]
MPRIVLIAGFEAFNTGLYRQAADQAMARCPEVEVRVFCDRDLTSQPEAIATALDGADVFFASLIFDYDQVLWLRERVQTIPIRLVFESALELMALTQLGKFAIGDKPKGMPKPIQFILSKFGNGREEDKLAGYLSFLKVGPKLLKYIPVGKVQDLRNWLIIYGYWNAGGPENVAAMVWTLAEKYLGLTVGEIPEAITAPNMGLLHPDYEGYFESPRQYLTWYQQQQPTANRPVVGLLLYRKHVITQQPYLPQLIRAFEAAGLVPLPIFINGVEGHVAVRDWMSSPYEQTQRALGQVLTRSLSAEAVSVDAIVSTIGFPLVGGPAGSMEAGRQVEVAKGILEAKNVPYLVAAPLLIQDIHSWTRQGVGGLQSVVLYALPELDGAIDPVPLGGLVGDDIYLIPERVQRLTGRVKQWIALRRKAVRDRKLAIILYGFPPGYGATGTAALLNVPRSLLKLLQSLQVEGYRVGDLPENGETLIDWVKAADDATSGYVNPTPEDFAIQGSSPELRSQGSLGLDSRNGHSSARTLGSSPPPPRSQGSLGGEPGAEHQDPRTLGSSIPMESTPTTVNIRQLEHWLGYLLSHRVEKQWGDLTRTGIKTDGDNFLLGGVQLGNIWIGVQPPLGIAGDPMRLMFERDLTPHPQYAAFYQWLQKGFQADAVVHFGMHGTVEWLPGAPLGNTGYSWSDILLGNLPHLYVYAANNPSESILAKRRGYGVLVSHNVPPYGRAGLYKDLVALRELIAEYREDPDKNAVLRDAILKKIADTGLEADCPFTEARKLGIEFTPENGRLFSKDALLAYFAHLYEYLQVLENRLFSSGLHVLGQAPDAEALHSYLEAYFGEGLKPAVLEAVVTQWSDRCPQNRASLETLTDRTIPPAVATP